MAFDLNLGLAGMFRWVDAEWGDRFSRWRIRRLKKERAKLRATIDTLEGKVKQLEAKHQPRRDR